MEADEATGAGIYFCRFVFYPHHQTMTTDLGNDELELADPFADWVFREPRQPNTPSVAGLNDHALGKLLGQFRRLATPRLPGSSPSTSLRRLSESAQLVVSPQPGYGKSHLIGRLFAALEGSATLIYVTPFQSASLCWQSVLLRTVQELTFPDRLAPADTAAGEPATQLDAFAHGVLAHLVARLIETGRLEHPDPAGAAAWLKERPLEAFALADPAHPWSHWLRSVFEHFHQELEGELRRAGLMLSSPGWLRVLFRLRVVARRRRRAPAVPGLAERPGARTRRGCAARPARGRTHPRRPARPDQRTLLASAAGFLPVGRVLPSVRILLRPDGSLRPLARTGACVRHGDRATPPVGGAPDDRRHRQPAALGGNRRAAHGKRRQGPLRAPAARRPQPRAGRRTHPPALRGGGGARRPGRRLRGRRLAPGPVSHRAQPHGHAPVFAGGQRALAAAGIVVAATVPPPPSPSPPPRAPGPPRRPSRRSTTCSIATPTKRSASPAAWATTRTFSAG